MKIPARLQPLVEDGLVDDVIRQLMSGKEATVYVVRCGDDVRCAKVYKEANQRSFRQSVDYTEGRKTKNSRQARAMEKGSKYGRKLQEQAWQSAEVDALYRLAGAGVRVPKPYNFYEGVLLMELVVDENGNAAPRLNDIAFTAEDARKYHQVLLQEVVRMLCAGIIHGDLSEFNILLSGDGPVIIDLPQAVDAAGNNHAESMLERDVNNLRDYFGRYAADLLNTQYAKEIWHLFSHGNLTLETTLTGNFKETNKAVDLKTVMRVIDDVRKEEAKRLRLAELGMK
jgi:RIO kinase 1